MGLLKATCKQCKGPIPTGAKGRGRKRSEYCSRDCTDKWWLAAKHRGAKALRRRKERPVDFEEARQDPEFQRQVAEILAWAEGQHPATPEAWGMPVEKQADNEGAEMVTRETAAVCDINA